MKHALIRHLFLDRFDSLFSPLRLLDANDDSDSFIIHVDGDGQAFLFRCFEVNRGTPNLLRQAQSRATANSAGSQPRESLALIAPHLSVQAQDFCNNLGVSCFDLSGNARICGADMRLKQNDHRAQWLGREQPQIFKGRARHIPMVLIAQPGRVWTTRELAREAQVSIGLASPVLNDLADQGCIETKAGKGRGGIRLGAPGLLLDTWRVQYAPAATAVTDLFSLDEPELVEQHLADYCRHACLPYAFTGASAAATLRVIGAHAEVTLYIKASIPRIKQLADDLGLLRFTSAAGSVKLLHAQDDFCFYGAQRVGQACIAHPVQIYLDLYGNTPAAQAQATTFREATLGF